MSNRPTVALALTVHEPGEGLVGLAEKHLPALAARYDALTARCSGETRPSILDLLRRHGASVHIGDGQAPGIDGIGAVRRDTIRIGLEAGTTHMQMCDFDRAIHWVAYHSEELEQVIAEIPNYDLVVLGRTDRAWDTHPPYQTETEMLFNKVFALVSGLPWDVGAGSRGLSRRAVDSLLELSREITVGVDAEWPLLLLGLDGFRLGYRRCEGLEFETADRFASEIEAAGGYEAWEAKMSADPARWTFRLRLSLLIAEAAVRYGRAVGGDG
jgi:hypothetical protein